MKFVKVKYTASGHGQGKVVSIDVKLPGGKWAGDKEFVAGREYLVSEEAFAEYQKLGGFELVEDDKKAKAPKAGGKK